MQIESRKADQVDTGPSRIQSQVGVHPRKKNVVADVLSRVDVEKQTFEGEKESVLKIYHIISTRADLATLLTNLSTHQQADPKLKNIKTRLEEGDETIAQYYQLNKDILFITIFKEGDMEGNHSNPYRKGDNN